MKNVFLFFIALFISTSMFAQNVSGVATNAETGEPLSGLYLLLTYTNGGIASETEVASDGSFVFTDIEDGTYNLEFYSYPDPVILGGDYFLLTNYPDDIIVDGGNVSGIEFNIPPHHPEHILTGTLYDAVTNEPITIQDFEVRLKLQYYVEFFSDYSTENGTYIIEGLPDWTYELNVFENDYYEGIYTDITIEPMNSDTVHMDFYLQPKMGATVAGVLLNSNTNEPIMQAGRTIKLNAINALFTETNEQGEFTFVNVPPGNYAGISVTSQDTSYVNTEQSEIDAIYVPEEGLDNIELYQQPWVSVHEISADDLMFEPGETKTVQFSIVNDDLVYGAIWGVNLVLPEGVTVLNSTPFYSQSTDEIIFEPKPECSSDAIIAWEGWHWVGIPPYASSEGNLDVLNEAAWAEVTLEFADSASMDNAPIFYEIFYDIHCYSIQPFSFGTIMMQNDELTGINKPLTTDNKVTSYPNPAADQTNINVDLDQRRRGKIVLYDLTGQEVLNTGQEVFGEGSNSVHLNTSELQNGIYYYNFVADDMKLTGKLVVSR